MIRELVDEMGIKFYNVYLLAKDLDFVDMLDMFRIWM